MRGNNRNINELNRFGRGFFTHALSILSADVATHWPFAR